MRGTTGAEGFGSKLHTALGLTALALLSACSADPANPIFQTPMSSGGSTSTGSGGTFGMFGSGGGSSGGAFGSGGSGGTTGGAFGSGGSGGATGGSGGDAGSGGSGGAVVLPPYCDAQTKLPLPLTVTDNFVVSGYYETSASELKNPADMCPTRADGAVGTCLTFEWTPLTRTWVGVLFQSMANNWSGPGHCIAEGATKVVFKARSDTDGALANFGAVGVDLNGQALTTEWVEYTLFISGVDYNNWCADPGCTPPGGVLGGFFLGMGREMADMAVRRIYVDDIRWVTE